MAIISINVFVASENPEMKALIALLVIIIILRLAGNIRPYKNDILNEIESREILTSAATIFGGTLFLNEETPDSVKLLLFIFIVFANFWFYTIWVSAYGTTFL